MKRKVLSAFFTATLVMLLGVSSSAQAIVPANSRLSIEGNIGGTELNASVTIIVNLKRSQPEIALISTGHQLGDSVSEVEGNLTTAGEAKFNPDTNRVGLGATAVLAVDGQTITVPSNGELFGKNAQKITGIEAGNEVAIGGDLYLVEAEVDEDGEDTTITPPEQVPECYECPCTLIADRGQSKQPSVA